jgi:hypothetical protein
LFKSNITKKFSRMERKGCEKIFKVIWLLTRNYIWINFSAFKERGAFFKGEIKKRFFH